MEDLRSTITERHDLQGYDRNIGTIDNILHQGLDEEEIHGDLCELYHTLLDNGSYSDWCFAQGFLSDMIDSGSYRDYPESNKELELDLGEGVF